MIRTLRARLSVSLIVMILLLAVFASVVLFTTQRLYLAEVQQKVNLEVAQHIVDERLLLLDGGEVDAEALDDVFHMLMVVNPSIEVYLLDADGVVLAYSAPEDQVVAQRVPLEPIRLFFDPGAELPILGLDPRHPETPQPFSAAPVEGPGGHKGYLYVIVGGEPYRSAVDMLRSSYAIRLGVVVLGSGLLAALMVGLLFFRWQTSRLTGLSRAVDRFRSGRFKEVVPLDTTPRGDADFDKLERSFEDMMRRMVDQLDRIERTDRERRELIANISHDLRTPLASLQGYLETLQMKRRTLSPDERERHLNVALRQASRLSTLIEELFELSKLDSGHMEMHPEIFPLGELVQDVVQKLEPTAGAKDVSLEVSIPEVATPVHADIGLMERALTNVIDNAVKYSSPGGHVRVDLCASGPKLRLTVHDDGPGIPPEDLSRVFEPFYRTSAARQADAEGSGLGLAIAQGILRLHHTIIRADSPPGGGAEFRFDLPVHV
jgi:signal transduction histidine kinase